MSDIVEMTMKKLISVSVIFFLFLMLPFSVFAQQANTHESVVLEKNQTITQDYFATGDTVTILGTIENDAYVAAGTVLFDGTVNGDLIVAGGTVNINGTVKGNIRATGGTITISGNVGKNVTTLSGTTTITNTAEVAGSLVTASGTLNVLSPLGKGMTFAAGNATIDSQINGNVLAGVGTLTLSDNARIMGNLDYYSDTDGEMTQVGNASVSGKINHSVSPDNHQKARNEARKAFTGFSIFLKALSLLSTVIVGLILIFAIPSVMLKTTQTLSTSLPKSLIVGFLFYLLMPLILVILFITLVGIPIGILGGMALFFLLLYSKIFAAILIGQFVLSYFKQKQSLAWTFVIGLFVYAFLTSIPLIGFIISIFALFGGTGALLIYKKELYSSLRSKKLV